MKIAVIGPGAIGGLVAGYLKLKGEEVSLVGHASAVKAIKERGLRISGARGDFTIRIEAAEKLETAPELAIFCTKTQDLDSALRDNRDFIRGAVILTTQNGIQADNIVSGYAPQENIIPSIVMFGATYLEPAKIVHNFEGSWVIGNAFAQGQAVLFKVRDLLSKAFTMVISDDIKAMKYLKIFVNANNCIPAILGLSMQEAFSDENISRISIAVWKEGLQIINKAGITLKSLPDFPLERLSGLCALPIAEAAKIYSGIMLKLSAQPLYGSILQSIKRGRPSEIDYINGEFIRLAQMNNLDASLNKKLMEMVHRVQETNKFFSKEDLLSATKGLFNTFDGVRSPP